MLNANNFHKISFDHFEYIQLWFSSQSTCLSQNSWPPDRLLGNCRCRDFFGFCYLFCCFFFCTRDLNVNLAFHDWHKITLVALNLLELSSAHGNEVKLWQFRNINALLNRMFHLSFIVSLFSLILSLYFLVTIAAVR